MSAPRNDRHLPRYTGEQVRAALGRPWPIIPARSFEELNKRTGELKIEKKPNGPWKALQGLEADDSYILHEAALWAFLCGAGTGIVALDADTDEALHGLEPHVATGRGVGGHIYVRHPGWKVRTRSGALPGLDVRGDGGLAYFHGASLKGPYRLLREPVPYEISDLPEEVAEAAGLLEPPKEREAADRGTYRGEGFGSPQAIRFVEERCESIRIAPDGEWNETFHLAVYGAAGLCAAGQLVEAYARDSLFGACDDPIEAEAVFESSWVAGSLKPWDLPEEEDTLDAIGVAKRFVRAHGNRVRYVKDMGVWLVWDEKRWKPDHKHGAVQEMAKQTIVEMHEEAIKAMTGGNALRHQALVSLIKQMATRIELVQKIAASDPAISVMSDDLDANPLLLNCQNGTVDLRTGTLWPHNPRDLITKITNVPYLAGYTGTWNHYLEQVQPEAEMREYLRRLMGYTLIGGVTEHLMLFLEGQPRTGKSTFMETVVTVVGDYAVTTSVDLFLQHSRDTYGLAQLRGARLISMAEFDEHNHVNVTLVKKVSGGDTVRAREIYGAPFEFKPQGTMWVSTNQMPWVGADEGAWCRVRRIPFDVSFLGREDASLPSRLARDPAVLAWIVQGAVEYLRSGMSEPTSVLLATQEVKHLQDPVARFIEEACKNVEGVEADAGKLYQAYRWWAQENGEKTVTSNKFGRRLTALGYGQRKADGRTYRKGIELISVTLGDFVK